MVSQLKVKVGGKDETLESIHLNRSMFEALLQDVLITKGNRLVELYEGHGASWQVARCVFHQVTFQLHLSVRPLDWLTIAVTAKS